MMGLGIIIGSISPSAKEGIIMGIFWIVIGWVFQVTSK